MSIKRSVQERKQEKMSNMSFRMMALTFNAVDLLYPYIRKRAKGFGIREGMTVVDYGCGPGRYATKFAELVGERGKVYAIDIHELAIEAVRRKAAKYNLTNIQPLLIEGYESTIPDNTADVVCAIDMFFMVKEPTKFLEEIRRIVRTDGMFIVDDGHQRRSITKQKILDSGLWDVVEETRDHLKCRARQLGESLT